MTLFIVEYSSNLSGTIGHFLKDIQYFNYTEPKVSKWFYRPCFGYIHLLWQSRKAHLYHVLLSLSA